MGEASPVCVAGLGVPPLAWGGLVLALGAVSMVLGVHYAPLGDEDDAQGPWVQETA